MNEMRWTCRQWAQKQISCHSATISYGRPLWLWFPGRNHSNRQLQGIWWWIVFHLNGKTCSHCRTLSCSKWIKVDTLAILGVSVRRLFWQVTWRSTTRRFMTYWQVRTKQVVQIKLTLDILSTDHAMLKLCLFWPCGQLLRLMLCSFSNFRWWCWWTASVQILVPA